MLEVLLTLAAIATFLIFVSIAMPQRQTGDASTPASTSPQLRARSIGKSRVFDPVVKEASRRSIDKSSANANYLRLLKQADWYWAPGEIVMPNPKAPFWNLETLWGEKIFGAMLWGGVVAITGVVAGIILVMNGQASFFVTMAAASALGGIVSVFMFTSPDSALEGAAKKRQTELALEMGYRIPELRSDVMAGNTVQRAIRNMARRPGGPFVAELRRTVTVLDVTKDDILAMNQLIERNEGNELLQEFANNLKMVSRQGGQIAPVLNTLAELAQERLRLSISMQARKNLQEMTRPIGLSSMIVTTILIILPAMSGVLGHFNK
jgi:Flp pilus assembly protein TadB